MLEQTMQYFGSVARFKDFRLVTIRDYRPSDVDALIELFRRSVREIARRDYRKAQLDVWAPYDMDRAAIATRNLTRPLWVAECGGRIAGFADLEETGHLDRMYVHPDFQRLGVASALLETIETSAKAKGIDRLYSKVSLTGHAFFKSRGFSIVALQVAHIRGQDFLNYCMEKTLGI
jgi:putative acetyltransferase